jgi:hypothetical protein
MVAQLGSVRVGRKGLLLDLSRHIESQGQHLNPAPVVLSAFQTAERFTSTTATRYQKLADLNCREIAIMVPLLVMIFVMGLYPKPFIDKMDPAIKKLVAQADEALRDRCRCLEYFIRRKNIAR